MFEGVRIACMGCETIIDIHKDIFGVMAQLRDRPIKCLGCSATARQEAVDYFDALLALEQVESQSPIEIYQYCFSAFVEPGESLGRWIETSTSWIQWNLVIASIRLRCRHCDARFPFAELGDEEFESQKARFTQWGCPDCETIAPVALFDAVEAYNHAYLALFAAGFNAATVDA